MTDTSISMLLVPEPIAMGRAQITSIGTIATARSGRSRRGPAFRRWPKPAVVAPPGAITITTASSTSFRLMVKTTPAYPKGHNSSFITKATPITG